jgi:DDE superfamily endonuclease
MEDVLDVYQRPYDPARPQVCLDEARQELHSTPKGTLPQEPGQPARQDYEYARHGTASLFVWVEPLTGRRKVRVTARQTGCEFAEQLRLLVEEDYPAAEQLVLVVDNLKTHSPACLYERFTPGEARRIARKIEWHYTPEHGSWLNMAECELSGLERQCLARRLPDVDTLKREVAAWEQKRNQAQVTIDWRFTTADARIKLKRLYPVFKEQQEQKAA